MDAATVARFQWFEHPSPAPEPGYCDADPHLARSLLDGRLAELGVVQRDAGYFPAPELRERRHEPGAWRSGTSASAQSRISISRSGSPSFTSPHHR